MSAGPGRRVWVARSRLSEWRDAQRLLRRVRPERHCGYDFRAPAHLERAKAAQREEPMHLEGQTEIAANRSRVWAALVDPEQVAGCAPARVAVETIDPTHFRVKIPVKTGFFSTTVAVNIELRDLAEPSRVGATASGSAMGGGGAATLAAELDEQGPRSTRLRWGVDVTLSGMLAGFASMAEEPAAQAFEDTIACLKSKLESQEAGEAGGAAG